MSYQDLAIAVIQQALKDLFDQQFEADNHLLQENAMIDFWCMHIGFEPDLVRKAIEKNKAEIQERMGESWEGHRFHRQEDGTFAKSKNPIPQIERARKYREKNRERLRQKARQYRLERKYQFENCQPI